MIRELNIANLALIESLHLTFEDGLSVLTGETGAGKSIILQAINLLRGGRAPASLVRSGADSARIEALFEIPSDHDLVIGILAEMGLETDDMLIIKRVITQQGRSRYYINGSLANGRLVNSIFTGLLSIAGQRDHHQLLNPNHHLDFIDSVGETWLKRREFTYLYLQWSEAKKQLTDLEKQEAEKERQRDFLAFQINEINQAHIRIDEDEKLESEKQRLKASDTLNRLGKENLELLHGSIIEPLAQVKKNLEQMASLDPHAAKLADNLTDSYYQIEDQSRQLADYCQAIPDDPAQLESINSRIDLLHQLKRKYATRDSTLVEILSYCSQAEKELDLMADADQHAAELRQQLPDIEKQLLTKAKTLSGLRKKTCQHLVESVKAELSGLSFDHAEFEVFFRQTTESPEELHESGWDRPEFMFSANPGEPLKPLIKVASGGELSRLILGLKCILAKKDQIRTVIFDEVDAGISGKAAEAVARKIKELSNHHQVICITHLPQIASYADDHFIVSKATVEKRTRTTISRLPRAQRPMELARMLAGDSVTQKTLTFAEELADRSRRPASEANTRNNLRIVK